MKQHLVAYEKATIPEREIVHNTFHKPRLLCVVGRKIIRDALDNRVTKDTFYDWLYRMGGTSTADYKMYNKFIRSPKVFGASAPKDSIAGIQKDFFSKMVRSGDYISLPVKNNLSSTDELASDAPLSTEGSMGLDIATILFLFE